MFQQDGARPHTANTTKQFLSERVRTLPEEYHWPASSPDLNVIENIWAIVKSKIDYHLITDADSLFREAERISNSLSLIVINNCMADFGPRLQACSALKGECLNRYKKVVKSFRVSLSAGESALEEIRFEKGALEEFLQQSEDFFSQDMTRYVPSEQLSDDPAIRSVQIASNHVIWGSPQDICRVLPPSVRSKCGLPIKIQGVGQ